MKRMKTLSLRELPQWVCALLAIGACIGLIIPLQLAQLRQFSRSSQEQSLDELQRGLSFTQAQLELYKNLPTFGFDNLVADWVFLNFLQYFGDDDVRNRTGYTLSPDYFESILNLDPYYRKFYLFLSSSTTLYAGQPERTVDLMNHALERLSPHIPPDSHYIWRYKGTDELLFLGDTQAAQKSFETAAEWASIHPDSESQDAANLSRQTAQFLENNSASRAARVSAWITVFQNAFDDQTRALAIQRIEELGAQVLPDGSVVIDPNLEDSVDPVPSTPN